MCYPESWHYYCHNSVQREWSGKGNYSLSLICLHIFLLFSVCTPGPPFFNGKRKTENGKLKWSSAIFNYN